MNSEQFEPFIADPLLSELLERQKTGNDALDVVRTLEVQHSRFLGWMLDSREGHGQGEEILRDLLLHASLRARSSNAKSSLTGSTKAFFKEHTLAKLRAMSLSSALVLHEYSITKASRLDLLVIDSQNKFVLLIENKAAAKLNPGQLQRYVKDWSSCDLKRQLGSGWATVFLVLDQKDDASDTVAAGEWLLLGYDWLRRAATRADMQVERGNATASLVSGYCKRHLEGAKTAADRRSTNVAAELILGHPEVMAALKPMSPGARAAQWLAKPESANNDLALFALQHRGVVAMLKDMDFYGALGQKVLSAIPELTTNNTYPASDVLYVRPAGWEEFEVVTDEYDPDWALELRISDTGEQPLRLQAFWFQARAGKRGPLIDGVIKKVFQGVERKEGLGGKGERYDRFELGSGMDVDQLISLLRVWQRRLSDAMAEAVAVAA